MADDRNNKNVRIYRVRRDYKTADLNLEMAEYLDVELGSVTDDQVEQLRAQYDKDWREWPVAWGAPFYDRDNDGVYTPKFDDDGNPVLKEVDASGNVIAEYDEPGVANADQVAWYVVNDLDLGATQALYGAKPIGIEEQLLVWAYARADALGDVIFKKYTLIYKGTKDTPDDARIEDMYFAQWSDPDLGDYGDDFVGSDVDLSLGYVYNATNSDSHYDAEGMAPPAAGYDFLQGPIVPAYIEDEEGNQVIDDTAEAIFNFQKRPGYRNLPMTAFVYFAAGSAIDDPELNAYNGTKEWYNLLRGFEPQPDVDNPTPYINEITGEVTTFTMSGDPVKETGWNDGVPLPAGDRRMVLATGPFELALNDTQEVVVALVGGSGSSRLSSVTKLKYGDSFAQLAYDNFFNLPTPPAIPDMRAIELDRTIVLDWGYNTAAVQVTEGQDDKGFIFEGYNIYQLPAVGAPLEQGVKLATYDLRNELKVVNGDVLHEGSGDLVQLPLQVGSDSGIRRLFEVKRDALLGTPLVNGQEYYFTVTAYNRLKEDDESAPITTLESTAKVVIAVPQTEPSGTRYQSEVSQMIDAEHLNGGSDGSAAAVVVNPTQTTGDSYKITFRDRDVVQDGEVVGTETVWNLVNTTTNTPLIEDEAAQLTSTSDGGLYVGAEGFEVRVAGPPNGMKDWDIPTGARWFTWAGADAWGLEGFGGAMSGDLNHQWFNETTLGPADLKTVELRFTSVNEADGEDQYKPLDPGNENVSWAYRYMRGSTSDAPAPEDLLSTSVPYDWSSYVIPVDKGGYIFQDRRQICLSAWDVESDPPRRLEVAFLENNVPEGLVNGAYGPAFYATQGNLVVREWLFIFDLDYTEPADAQDGAGVQDGRDLLKNNSLYLASDDDELLPLMWWIVAGRRQEARFPQDGDSFLLMANHVNTAVDEFTFTVPGAESSDELSKEDVKLINVFPNPYYGVNEAETSPYSHFVTFSHLPQKMTIRIYDLSGTLVRKLTEDDKSNVDDQFLRWDLTNHNELPVASGLYIAHIELPDINKSKVLKFAIVQEQQFLQNF